MKNFLYPLLLAPVYKDYIWGGERLKKDFGKDTDLSPLAESWELACHKDGTNRVINGECAGRTLQSIIEEHPSIVGEKVGGSNLLPVMVKLIDANDDLSVQVHPDDDYAAKTGCGCGKSEMWYVLDAEENAEIIYGFIETVTKIEFETSIKNGSLMGIVNRVKVKKGDVYFTKAGTLHAIGKGTLVAEIQQNSNTTYRVYDYGRKGKDGKHRPLHIEDALNVTVLEKTCQPKIKLNYIETNGHIETLLTECPYFRSKLIKLKGEINLFAGRESFHHLLCTESYGVFEWKGTKISLKKGDSLLVPAGCGEYTITGTLEYILTEV